MNHYFFRHFRPRFLFDASTDKGGGKIEWPDEVLAGFKKLLVREGGEKDAARKLYEENYEYRKEIRELKAKIEETKGLTDDEHKEYQAFKELLKDTGTETAEALKEKVDKASEAQTELASLKKEQSNQEVAEVLGWNAKVLNKLGSDYEYQVKTRKDAEGNDQKYVVATKDGKESEVSEDFAKQNFGEDFLPSLIKEGGDEGGSPSNGKPFPRQASGGGGNPTGGGDLLEEALAANRKARGLEK